MTKTETVVITEDATIGNNTLFAGTYRIEIPADYDASLVTGEDVLCDYALTVITQ